MSRIRVTVPAFLGGISQQSDAVRRNNTVEDAVNVEFQASQGASKRYPTEHVAEITSAPAGANRAVFFDRDDTGIVALVGDTIKVVDVVGNTVDVYAAEAGGIADFSYLTGASYREIRSQTVADAAFIVNTSKVVAGLPGRLHPSWARPTVGLDLAKGEAGVFVKQANYGVTFSVEIKTASMAEPETVTATIPEPSPRQEGRINFTDGAAFTSGTGNAITAAQADGTAPILLADGYTSDGFKLFANQLDDMTIYLATGSIPTLVQGAALDLGDWEFDAFSQALTYKGTLLALGSQIVVTRRDINIDFFLDTNWAVRKLSERLALRFAGGVRPQVALENNRDDSSLRLSFNEELEVFEVRDSVSDTYSSGWTDQVDDITDLPLVFKHGAVVRIAGQTGDEVDDYFVEFASEEWDRTTDRDFDQFDNFEGYGKGSWIETSERGLATGTLDAATMPHLLQRHIDEDGSVTGTIDETYFSFGPAEWEIRGAGSTTTNKEPSIVGNSINDVFFFEDRLGFVSGNSMTMSESGDSLNLWRTTVLSLPDSDRIDVDLTSLDGDNLQHVVPFDARLLAFGTSSQAQVSGGSFLSPRSISAPVVSNYQTFPDVSPVIQGRSVFFGAPTGPFCQMREFVPGTQSEIFQDALITLAVPELIPRTVRRLIASTVDQTLLFLTDEPNTIFVYQYLREQGSLFQASWTKWVFPEGTLLDCGYIREDLYLVIERNSRVYLEKATIGTGRTDNSLDFKIRCDRLSSPFSSSYNSETGLTSFVLPWEFTEDSALILAADNGGDLDYGAQIPVDSREVGFDIVRVVGDFSAQPMVCGIKYDCTLTLSKPISKRISSNGTETVLLGGYQNVQDLTLYLDNTGYLEATVTQVGYDSASDEFIGEELGTGKLEQKSIRSGEFSVGIFGDPEEFQVVLSNPSVLPSTIVSGAWSIQFNSRLPIR